VHLLGEMTGKKSSVADSKYIELRGFAFNRINAIQAVTATVVVYTFLLR
jgi:hypothetical protein